MQTASGFTPAIDEKFPETRESRNQKQAARAASALLHEDVRRTYAWMEHLRDAWGSDWNPQD